jgi:hypothetical protein
MMHNRSGIAAICVGGLIAVGAVGAIAGSQPADATSRPTGTSKVYSAVAAAPSAADQASASPLLTAMMLDDPELGLRPGAAKSATFARAARTSTVVRDLPQGAVTIVPAAQAPCLLIKKPDGKGEGLNCGGDSGPTVAAGPDGAIGIVPDSVQTVHFAMEDGTTEEGAVVDNLWVSPAQAVSVSMSIDGSVKTIELYPVR